MPHHNKGLVARRQDLASLLMQMKRERNGEPVASAMLPMPVNQTQNPLGRVSILYQNGSERSIFAERQCTYCLYVWYEPFGSLWGHYSLQTALEAKSDLRYKISDPNYLLIHVHIVYSG